MRALPLQSLAKSAKSGHGRVYPFLVLIILLGCALRLFQLNRMPLRGDEAFTVLHWMREPFAQTIAMIATADPQPPLAYALYRAFGLIIGSQEYVVRFLPALANLLGIPALYLLGRRLYGVRAGLFASLLCAVHPYLIWHAQDARGYALWSAANAVSLAIALLALHKKKLRWYVLYVLSAWVAGYLYYLEVFVMASLSFFVFLAYRRERQIQLRWFASQFIVGIGLAFWYVQPRLLVSSGYGGTAGTVDPVQLLTWFVPTLLFGERETYSPALFAALAVVGVLIVVVAFGYLLYNRQYRSVLLIALLAAVAMLLLSLVSIRLQVFTPRYVLAVVIPLILLVVGLSNTSFRLWNTVFRVGVLCFSGYGSLLYFGMNDYTKSPDWRDLSSYLHDYTQSEEVILNTSADEAFTFYHDELNVAAPFLRLPANRNQSQAEITRVLEQQSQATSAMWVIADTPADWPNRGVVESWLNAHMQLVWQDRVNGLRADQFRAWSVDQPEQAQIQRISTFEAAVPIVGYQVFRLWNNQTLLVWLYWRPEFTTDVSLKAFVHLTGETNPQTGSPLWSQDDQFPQEGRVDTSAWPQGGWLRDVYVLPLEHVPSGTYQLQAGMYDPNTGERVDLPSADDTIVLSDVLAP